MLDLKEEYILDKEKKPIAVKLDIKIFKQIENLLENYALAQYMKESTVEEGLNLNEAKAFYKKLTKK